MGIKFEYELETGAFKVYSSLDNGYSEGHEDSYEVYEDSYEDSYEDIAQCIDADGVMAYLEGPKRLKIHSWTKCSASDFQRYVNENGGEKFCLYQEETNGKKFCILTFAYFIFLKIKCVEGKK